MIKEIKKLLSLPLRGKIWHIQTQVLLGLVTLVVQWWEAILSKSTICIIMNAKELSTLLPPHFSLPLPKIRRLCGIITKPIGVVWALFLFSNDWINFGWYFRLIDWCNVICSPYFMVQNTQTLYHNTYDSYLTTPNPYLTTPNPYLTTPSPYPTYPMVPLPSAFLVLLVNVHPLSRQINFVLPEQPDLRAQSYDLPIVVAWTTKSEPLSNMREQPHQIWLSPSC